MEIPGFLDLILDQNSEQNKKNADSGPWTAVVPFSSGLLQAGPQSFISQM